MYADFNVRCALGGVSSDVVFAGTQGTFPALDQINIQIPASLRGRGTVDVNLTVDSQNANTVTIRCSVNRRTAAA